VYAAKLRSRNKIALSVQTVRNALHQNEYNWRLPGRKKLNAAQKASRLAFAQAHFDDNWDETWAFDECYFNLQRHSNRCWVSARTEESVQLPKLTRSQEKISVGVAFAICRDRKSALCFLPKNWQATDLIKVFKETLLPSIRWPKQPSARQRFIIDNDGRHQTQVWKEYVLKYRLHAIDPWPSNSPDLNPIENFFAWVKRFVESRAPSNERELREAVQAAFKDFPEAKLKNFFSSMRQRMEATISANGARINY
jgi:transposase